jgi:hypothetical protein
MLAQADLKAGTALPLEKRATPFKGTVMLYADKGCSDPLIPIGVTEQTLAVTEDECYDDTILGLLPTGFKSFKFELPGDHIDPTDKVNKKKAKVFVVEAFSSKGCPKKEFIARHQVFPGVTATGCVHNRQNKVAQSFSSRRL